MTQQLSGILTNFIFIGINWINLEMFSIIVSVLIGLSSTSYFPTPTVTLLGALSNIWTNTSLLNPNISQDLIPNIQKRAIAGKEKNFIKVRMRFTPSPPFRCYCWGLNCKLKENKDDRMERACFSSSEMIVWNVAVLFDICLLLTSNLCFFKRNISNIFILGDKYFTPHHFSIVICSLLLYKIF